jgi:hypothetical protein
MYYPNDYQTHSAPGSFIRRGGRGQGVNFINILQAPFFVQNVFCTAFL